MNTASSGVTFILALLELLRLVSYLSLVGFLWCCFSATSGLVASLQRIRGLSTLLSTSSHSHYTSPTLELDTYPGAFSDFRGLPSNPVCVYRTGDEWPVTTGIEAQPVLREARPICKHPIQRVWFTLGTQIYRYLDSLEIKWSTIDPICFAEEGKDPGPLHLWVGVAPSSLSFRDAKSAAMGCKKILSDANLPDVEIAFRESDFTRYTGPRLLDYAPYTDPTVDVCSAFTPALGIKIARQEHPHLEGTGALYLRASSQSDQVLLLTARHVVLPPSNYTNDLYVQDTSRQHAENENVLILGNGAYSKAISDMLVEIEGENILVDAYKTQLEVPREATEGEDDIVRQRCQDRLTKAEMAIAEIRQLRINIVRDWDTAAQRVLGSVIHAPPISFGTGPKGFTEDWAIINLHRDKIDWNKFKGNVIHLGKMITADEFIKKMHPHPQGRSSFHFPNDGLLEIKGIVGEDEICSPKQLDADGKEFLPVIKNGRSTKVTVGRGTGIESIVRKIDEYGLKETSREFAIYSYSCNDSPFSAPGDSGSIVVDGKGRIVGLLTAGAGRTGPFPSTDVTYITPYFWLDERIKQAFPESYLYPGAT